MADKKTYKDTLNLPQTPFPMEAKLVANEPKRLEKWKGMDLYALVQQSRASAPKWILHDGPPFANGDIHMGHLTNKTLKDVILRYKTMAGFATPYVPGWDCHGLPIEHKIQQELGKKFREMSALEVRQECYKSAEEFAGKQSEQFQRLGILGDWANPYLTMKPAYEASTLEVFARVVENGLVYKQLKTVPWSIANQTALADAELEYQDVTDTSVYVAFPVANPGAFKAKFDIRVNAKVSFLIWTTTPWTLPANLAIAAGENVDYALVQFERNGDTHITVIAQDLIEKVFAKLQRPNVKPQILKRVKGSDLEGLEYTHPFLDRTGKVLLADYVTTTDGTGLVHTAPGHGEDDYNTGVKHGLEIYCPVLPNGRFDSTTPNWLAGITVWEGNGKVVEKLEEVGALFAQEQYLHSYPHDWRSKTPIVFRATEQWFVAIDKPFSLPTDRGLPALSIRQRAELAVASNAESPRASEMREEKLAEVRADNARLGWTTAPTEAEAATTRPADRIDFIPDWGRRRIQGMLTSRPDWCISRQRSWGLPIPVFYNEQNEPLLTPESVRAVANVFAREGSDAWFTRSPSELLEGCDPGPKFPKEKLRKEKDIFDVWFESGSSWNSVLRAREDVLSFPADLYLEGSDQHRGWFQLSMLPALGSIGEPPFKQVLTHGFIVGPDGKKISKSDKNYVKAVEEVNRHGADLLRLFVCQLDYEGDMAASPKLIQEFGDKYRKLRNTLRYLLSNLYDYTPSETEVDVPDSSLDGWALAQLDELIAEVTKAYEEYALYRAFRLLHDFCSVQLSAVYGNAMKDRLYCEIPDSPLRRRSQFVMHKIVIALTKLLAPMLVYTADEAWEFIPHKPADEKDLPSVHLAHLPKPSGKVVTEEQRGEWARLMELREQALAQLDKLKKDAGMNKASDAEVIFRVEDESSRAMLQRYGVDLADMVGAGHHMIEEAGSIEGPAVEIEVKDRRNDYQACARSWKRRPDVGSDADYPDLCARDAAAMKARA